MCCFDACCGLHNTPTPSWCSLQNDTQSPSKISFSHHTEEILKEQLGAFIAP